jgi:hypothetical protein
MIQQQLAETVQLISNKPVLISGAAGAGTALTPTSTLNSVAGNYLATHGIGLLSYTELMQVAGAVWVCCLIADYAYKAIRSVTKIK